MSRVTSKYQIKKRWQGKFKDKKNTDEYMSEIRGEVILIKTVREKSSDMIRFDETL